MKTFPETPNRVFLSPAAARDRDKLPAGVQARIDDAIRRLAPDPRSGDCRKLRDTEGWRVRVGDYRIVYMIDDDERLVLVIWIGLRKDAYRGN